MKQLIETIITNLYNFWVASLIHKDFFLFRAVSFRWINPLVSYHLSVINQQFINQLLNLFYVDVWIRLTKSKTQSDTGRAIRICSEGFLVEGQSALVIFLAAVVRDARLAQQRRDVVCFLQK